MIVNGADETQVRRWISGLSLGIAGAVVGAARLLDAGEADALVFPLCLLLSGGVLAGLALLLGWEAERVAASRRPAGFLAQTGTSRLRSFARRARLEALTRLGYDAEILAVLALSVGTFGVLAVLAGSL